MSERRLSKLQKWILENCFKVTVLLDRSGLKELKNIRDAWNCRACPKTAENVIRDCGDTVTYICGSAQAFHCFYFDFYKEDVLLSFFSLIPDNDINHYERVQHFRDSPDYAKAHVTLHRSIKSLMEKGLIFTWKRSSDESLAISLTGEGMKKAAELLNINDFKSPLAEP